MVKRNANSISFFKATSELIERKYKLDTCSVAKSGLSTLCKIEEFLNLNSGGDTSSAIPVGRGYILVERMQG